MKTIKVNGVEYETETHDFNKKLEDIKIPKGWRLWESKDFEKFSEEQWIELGLEDDWFFIKQFSKYWKKKGKIAWFGASPDGAYLDLDGNRHGAYPRLGVRFCRKLTGKDLP